MSAPTVTVKDVWRSVLPHGTELLAGGAGLERRVEWACALRTRPPAFDAVKGGEIAFVPVHLIRLVDERLDLSQVMTSFAEKGGVAVAILGDAPASSFDVADRLMLPLLRLPEGTHLSDAHHACVRFVLDQRTLLHERAQELQAALMELALGGAGPAAIVERVAGITGLAAFWIGREGHLAHAAGDHTEHTTAALLEEAAALLRWGETVPVSAADPPVREFEVTAAGEKCLASPIPARDGVGGFVAIVGPDARLDQVARLAVIRAASACAIELDRERAVLETRERVEGEFVGSLLSGAYASDEVAAERARRLGVDMDGPFVVVTLRGLNLPDGTWEPQALATVRNALERREARCLVAAHQGAVCTVVFLDRGPVEAAARLSETVRGECARVTGDAGTSAGVGRAGSGPAAVRASYREAEQALAMGRKVLGPGRTASFAELGLHRLLFAMAQHPELIDFYEDALGRLAEYDERSGGELLSTLNAFFACNGSPTETAQRLHLHRNTVLYRLRRVEQIGDLSLDDPTTRLNLHLCLRIGDVLQVTGRRTASTGTRRAG